MKCFHGTRNFIRINGLADVINDVIQKYNIQHLNMNIYQLFPLSNFNIYSCQSLKKENLSQNSNGYVTKTIKRDHKI